VLTEMVMHVAPVERPIASAAHSFVRFTAGAVAPFLAGTPAEHIAPDVPFFVGAAALAVAVGVLAAGRMHLRAALHAPPPAAAPAAA
jgi:MFS transporter, ACDE family, multidrug resistance protein